MSKFKKVLLDTSLFRRSYVICMFCSNLSFILIPAYAVLAVLFVWGVFLMIYNAVKHRTVLKTRLMAVRVCGDLTRDDDRPSGEFVPV